MDKILIIDDDRELCALIKRSVQSEHIEADFCNTGKEGLQKLKEQEYQLVVLDVMMPGMDGFETLEEIRKENSLPILMFTLIGYLDAAHKGLVTGKDRDDYIEIARRKAHDLKEYIDVLFDWFKLNSDEFALEIQSVEAAELTRNILIDWIPIFEDKQVDYDIDIPEQPVRVRLDTDSYMRIINNLIQNVIAHSHADKIKIALSKQGNNLRLLLADNGVGIEKEDLKHIFERLYKCDKGRSEKGSGLGLSIVHQLVEKMGGSITVESLPGKGTEFMLLFPLES